MLREFLNKRPGARTTSINRRAIIMKQWSVKVQHKSEYVPVGCSTKYTQDNDGYIDKVQLNWCEIWTAIPPSRVSFFFRFLYYCLSITTAFLDLR